MYHDYSIDYKNITLRPLREQDIEYLRKWRNDPRNTTFLRRIPFISAEMQKVWFDNYINNDNEMCFAIIENKDLNRIVGSLSLYEFSDNMCLFGKILVGDEEAHGKKIGLNATKAALIIAFDKLKLQTVNLYVYYDNIVAKKIYKEAGFVIESIRRADDGKKELIMTIDRRNFFYA